MSNRYADVIINISHENVDHIFQYLIPDRYGEQIRIGDSVRVPFGRSNTIRNGYVVGFSEDADYEADKIKTLDSIDQSIVSAESGLIRLAWWLKERYGSTMNQSLKTVLPVKKKVAEKEYREIQNLMSEEKRLQILDEAHKKNHKGKIRLIEALAFRTTIPYTTAVSQLNIPASTIKSMEQAQYICIKQYAILRNPVQMKENICKPLPLNEEQKLAAESIKNEWKTGKTRVSLLYGITGSGKTEVYLELIEQMIQSGKQVIVLIPEISLTYQTVLRFYRRFGDRISIINSKLSAGERFDQYERARKGLIDIMIGPRSAIFTPFEHLGLIIIDEEHEGSYQSETVPRYDARETAIRRAESEKAFVVMGSATPSLESYKKALEGEYGLHKLNHHAKADSIPAKIKVVDMREELKNGNKSIFSTYLKELMDDRIQKKEQIMLFLNRRGMSGFVSCRSCGKAIRCPHCDVSLTLHRYNRLVCHYCGYSCSVPKTCPSCGSPYIAGFGIGTQKIEDILHALYPDETILRMDMDTTRKKGGHEKILSEFAEGRARILVGTQMIVKGHDYPKVTLVGILAADLSLLSPDYKSSERTFQLLTQAAGRAGRGEMRGEAVIQTYNPEHYSITAAAGQNYESFYAQEMGFRKMLAYPPVCAMMVISGSSPDERKLDQLMTSLYQNVNDWCRDEQVMMIGPANAPVYKVNDIYRKNLYIKSGKCDILFTIKTRLAGWMKASVTENNIYIQYDIL